MNYSLCMEALQGISFICFINFIVIITWEETVATAALWEMNNTDNVLLSTQTSTQ